MDHAQVRTWLSDLKSQIEARGHVNVYVHFGIDVTDPCPAPYSVSLRWGPWREPTGNRLVRGETPGDALERAQAIVDEIAGLVAARAA